MAANAKSTTLVAASSQTHYITDAAQTGLDFAGAFSISMWIKINTAPTSGNFVVLASKFDSGGVNQRAYLFYYENNGGVPRLALQNSTDGTIGNTALAAVNVTLATSKWIQIGMSKTGTQVDFYVDGQYIGSGTGKSTQFNSTASFAIGSRNNGGVATTFSDFFDGLISEVIVYSGGIDVYAMQRNASTPYDPYLTNAVSRWKFDNSEADAVGTNTLTNSGSATFTTDVANEFNIVFDSADDGTTNASFGHTMTAVANGILFAVVRGGVAEADNKSATWGGVAMSKVAYVVIPSGKSLTMFSLINPSTGANTIAITGGTIDRTGAMSYCGVKQVAQPEASNTGTDTGATSLTISVTTTTAYDWLVGIFGGRTQPTGAGTNTHEIFSSGNNTAVDSGVARVSTGSNSLQAVLAASDVAGIVCAIAPYIFVPPIGGTLPMMGV